MSPIKDIQSTARPHGNVELAPPNTPSRKQSAKKRVRVRFSEVTLPSRSTGLTPHMGRTLLTTPRRRASVPFRVCTPHAVHLSEDEIQFPYFRQVLDERSKRRIRRNGLSEEMNDYEAERKVRARQEKTIQAMEEEMSKLRDELEAAKQNNNNDAAEGGGVAEVDDVASSQRIDKVEAEIAALRESFNDVVLPEMEDDGMEIDWEHVTRRAGRMPGPSSDSGDTIRIFEDDDVMPGDEAQQVSATSNHANVSDPAHDAEILAMALDLETAKQEKRQLFNDVRSHLPSSSAQAPLSDLDFADSPSHPCNSLQSSSSSLASPPKNFYHDLARVLKATTSRAEDAELALHALEVELKTLGFAGNDASEVIAEIQAHFRTARIELERAVPGETVSAFENANVLPEIIAKLQLVSRRVRDREAELKTMREQQRTMKGNFDHCIIAAEKANARVTELEEAIETGAEEMLGCRMRAQALEKEGQEKDKTISSLIAALEKYREDVNRLEQMVIQLETEHPFKVQQAEEAVNIVKDQQISDLEAKILAEETRRRDAEATAAERLNRTNELENAMAAAKQHAQDVLFQLRALVNEKEEQEFQIKKILLEKDEHYTVHLASLNTRISNLGTALASANAEVDKLKVTNSKLEDRVKAEMEQGQHAVETLHLEMVRSFAKVNEGKNSYLRGTKIRLANAELEDEGADGTCEPMTPVSLVRFVDVEASEAHIEGSVEIERGRKRMGKGKRRFDSGIGIGSSSGAEEDAELPVEMPSSEADVETL